MYETLKFLNESPILLYSLVAIFSLCIGSFLNVVIYRTPKQLEEEWKQDYQQYFQIEDSTPVTKISLSFPASHCPNCKAEIKWYQNIPVVSWIALLGRCNHCKSPISIRYPFIELLTMLLSLFVVFKYGLSLQALSGLIFTWILIILTFIDFDKQLLPDRYTLTLGALGLLISTQFLFVDPTTAIYGYVAGFLSLWIVYYVFKLITGKEGMGYGDFKLMAALGAWVGISMIPLIVFFSSILCAIIGIIIIRLKPENRAIAFGPYIAIAGWIALFFGDQIMKMYLG